ncbi:MAG: hypothetical protein FJZ58_00635 [Chlamydiae bacterium]|nr:hypothetical protein [Chlamydiota bacterium]
MEDLLQTCQDSTVDIWTLKTPLSEDRAGDPNICKVVCSQEGKALYFSRSPIPFSREGGKGRRFFKHIGLYAYANHALQTMPSLSPCMLEEAEMLEQLRFLFHGLHVQVHETQEETLGIDLPEHLTEAETWMKQGKLLV